MESLNSALMLLLLMFSAVGYGQDQASIEAKDREIVVYRYDSKVFAAIVGAFNDSTRQKFQCEELDLASLSIIDSNEFLRIKISPRSGKLYNIDRNAYFEDSIQIGLKLEDSETIYLVLNRYFDLVKSIGNVEYLFKTDARDFVSRRTNDCIYNEYSAIIYSLTVDYYWRRGLVAKTPSFYGEKKD
ncbi:MAG: hypothetical protein JNK77_01385 [Saprospiraceae bacterium]|nr:hypothetical protein [Saprospiraceae bacterium]